MESGWTGEQLDMTYRTFDTHADEYDSWYDSEPGKTIFAMEVACLRLFLHGYRRPYLEVGVGSGRFARALGIEYGIDPGLAPLEKASSRGVLTERARGENLPFADSSFGAVLVALTLCFVDDPARVVGEASRVLLPGGGLVLGLILKGSPWAEYYIRRGKEGHPIYSRAHFFLREEVEGLLGQAGFGETRYRSVLFQPPGQGAYRDERPADGYVESAGFVAIGSRKLSLPRKSGAGT